MNDALSVLLADGVITEVIGRLKSGKEADIYLVQHAGEIVAAKLYKEKAFRSFRNDAAYREGRSVRSSRTQRAIDKGTRFGQAAAEDAWKTTESDVLQKLFSAGVRVPKPYLFYEGVLLMEAVIDAEGHPAPRLIDAQIPKEAAAALYADIRGQAIQMLLADLIHGDLSPYNVLLAWNGPTLIDFPQVVGAAHNNRAEFFFTRDLETIRRFFAGIDPALAANHDDARHIWRAYTARELRPGYTPPLISAHAPRSPEGGHRHGRVHAEGQRAQQQRSSQGRHRAENRQRPQQGGRPPTQGQQPRHRQPNAPPGDRGPIVTFKGAGAPVDTASPAALPARGGDQPGSADAAQPRRRRRRRRGRGNGGPSGGRSE